jgi:predicted DNA-binding transcriptional regulator AlpA
MSESELRALEWRIEELETRLKFPRLMTARQLCDFLGISEALLYEWKRKGDAPPVIHFSERSVRYDLHSVMEWAKRKEVGGQA